MPDDDDDAVGAIASGRRRRTTLTIAMSGEALLKASEAGSLTDVRRLLDANAFPSFSNASGTTSSLTTTAAGSTSTAASL